MEFNKIFEKDERLTDWHITKYGTLIEDFTREYDEGREVNLRLYKYNGEVYAELWDGKYRVYFGLLQN